MSIAQSILANPGKYSLEQLKQGVENGVIPAYIGVPIIQEMLQKQAQMQSMGQEQMPPVMDQVMAQANQGLETLPSNLPQEYAGGGIIAFQEGGQTQAPMRFANQGSVQLTDAETEAEFERMRRNDQSPEQTRAANMRFFVDEYKKMLPEKDPRLTAYEASITKTPEQLDARKNQDMNLALAQFGLNLMGSKSRSLLGGISEAAAPVLPSVQAALTSRRTAEDAALKGHADMARTDRAEGIAALTGGLGLYSKEEELLSEETRERLKREEGRPPTEQIQFVKNYVALQLQDPNNKKSVEQLTHDGFLMNYSLNPQAVASQNIAAGAQNVQKKGQGLDAETVGIKEWNNLDPLDPYKREAAKAYKRDQANAAKGIISNEADQIRDKWIQANTPGAKPTVPPKSSTSVLPPGATTGKTVPGKGTEVLVNGKLVGYAN